MLLKHFKRPPQGPMLKPHPVSAWLLLMTPSTTAKFLP
jgi:hypothetical protein